MKVILQSIYEEIASRYREWSPALSLYLLISIIMQVLYRVRILTMIRESHADFRSLGFMDYMSLFGRIDAVTTLLILAILLLIFMAAGPFRKAGLRLASAFTLVQCVVLVLGMDFFRVYETTFQKSFWTDENNSALGEMFISILSETSLRFWVFLFILTVILIAFYRLFVRAYNERDLAPVMNTIPAPVHARTVIMFPAAAALVLLALVLFTGGHGRLKKMAERYPGMDVKKSTVALREFAMSPLYNLALEKQAAETGPAAGKTAGDTGRFTYRFNTDSIENSGRYDEIDLIPRGRRYNIILYFFESTAARYIDLDINGSAVTPVWRRLRENSLSAENHYANFPLSANALLSIMTSAYDHPSKDLIIQKHSGIGLTSLSQVLKDRGYRTCVIHPGDLRYAGQKRFLKYRKFDRIIDYNDMKDIPPYNYKVGWGLDERSMIEPSVAFMKEKREAPFFMMYIPVNPHHPYAIPGKEFSITGTIPVNADYKTKNWLNYVNSLHYADAALGTLVDRLEKEGLMENTLLFLFADHGEAFYEHAKNYNHPFFLYEDNVHVPFLVYNRKLIKKARQYRGISRHIDIMPSILDLLNIRGPAEQEGISFFSPHRQQMALLHTYWKDDYMAVRDGKWKYIRRMKEGFEELYDIENDPGEKINLAAGNADLVSTYRSHVLKAREHKLAYYNIMLKKESSPALKKGSAAKSAMNKNRKETEQKEL